MINLINWIITKIKGFIAFHRMNYEMKRSMRCITLISEAILSDSIYPHEDAIVDELILLESTGVSLASDLNLMFNCLLYLEDLEDVSVDDYVDWTSVMTSVKYINHGVRLLADAFSKARMLKTLSGLTPNQMRYINKYGDIVEYLLAKSKVNHALTKQI